MQSQTVTPPDILSAAKSIKAQLSEWYYLDVCENLTPAETYLEWAHRSLELEDEFGYDAALTYSKRAVCRRIDGLVRFNHLIRVTDHPYPKKIAALREVGVKVPKDIIHDLIINPRNEVEHECSVTECDQSVHAVELADLFVRATANEAEWPVPLSYGMSMTVSEESSSSNDKMLLVSASLNGTSPFLIIDYGNGEDVSQLSMSPDVLIVFPDSDEVQRCSLQSFSPEENLTLTRLLRTHFTVAPTITTNLWCFNDVHRVVAKLEKGTTGFYFREPRES